MAAKINTTPANIPLHGNKINYRQMHTKSIVTTTALVIFMASAGCNGSSEKDIKTDKAFYHWKSVFNPTAYEKETLSALNVKTLYIKFFDVDWDNNSNRPLPVAPLRIKDTSYLQKDVKIIPVIFVTNSCIRHLDSLQAEVLGGKIIDLVNATCALYQLHYSEFQMDCDWTERTREPYFILLRSIKKQQPAKILSATIRLYQIKYRGKTGVPPVDRGMLMSYNMGNLKDPSSANSILDTKELKKYISGLSLYPLQLDIALPLFDWKVLFRKDSYAGLIENLPDTFLNNVAFTTISANHYQAKKDTVLDGYAFNKGDVVRKETSGYGELLAAEKILAKNISGSQCRISLFHLDSLILKKYTTHEMENIFSGLH